MDKIKRFGQVFTRQAQIDIMLGWREHNSTVLEPSCGDGAISSQLPGVTAIEMDPDVCPVDAMNMDFFDYPTSNKFKTIVANPPYVKHKNILPGTVDKITNSLPAKTNLYIHFIEKCFHHLEDDGEMIFINPMDFMNSYGSEQLIDLLLEHGTITHFVDVSGEKIFDKANPDSCCMWRYRKGSFNRTVSTNEGTKRLLYNNGRVFIVAGKYTIPFDQVFKVRVGAVPGQGDKFFGPEGEPFVFSKTRVTGETRSMVYLPKEWIRSKPRDWNVGERVYVNNKTLTDNPFFAHPCDTWDGSVLALFPLCGTVTDEMIQDLNNVDWNDLGFMWHGKYVFTSGGLTNCLLPLAFSKYVK